jgi:hypothetical protein
MLTPLIFVGFVLLIAGVIGSRYLGERALKLLSPEEKLKLLDSFSGLRAFGAVPLLLVFISFLGVSYLPSGWYWPAYFGACVLVGIYFVIIHRLIFRKMRDLGINANYIAAQQKVRWCAYGGIIAFFVFNTLNPFVYR